MPRKKRRELRTARKILNQDISIRREKLTTLKSRKSYKTDYAYMRAVYTANKDYIEARISPSFVEKYGTAQKAFYALVREQLASTNYNEGRLYTVDEAVKKVNNSSEMNKQWSKSDIKANNFKELLKKDKEIWNELRKKEFRENGRFAKYDPSKLKYKGQYNDGYSNVAVYKYGDTIIIERKSPNAGVGASLEIMDFGQFDLAVGNKYYKV